MPSGETFKIKPIRELLGRRVLGTELWLDPFAGRNTIATMRNDLNPECCTEYCQDALAFLEWFDNDFADGVLFDPPYSITQAAQLYKMYGKDRLKVSVSNMKYWASIKNEMARVIKPGGMAICCGWSSMGLGKSRGFEMREVLLVPHGGMKNDTIVTVEFKL